ncbi:hypothetical protein HYDPIDRAFT_24368 [Hydnomerulius pinastri MD-312]|nr:hypothetical protein HYDPIDRAFT_24368 [Hydnomerulius pinastri MD-312]
MPGILRPTHPEEFVLVRPQRGEDIDAQLSEVLGTLSLQEKWDIIYAVKKIRWQKEKVVREQAHTRGNSGRTAPPTQGLPEWYIDALTKGTITVEQASNIYRFLKVRDASWVDRFLDLRGAAVLAQALAKINRKGIGRRAITEANAALELEVAKCLKVIFSSPASIPTLSQQKAQDSLKYPDIVKHITSTLNSSDLSTRRNIFEVLQGIIASGSQDSLDQIFRGLAALSQPESDSARGAKGPYDYWFQQLEITLCTTLELRPLMTENWGIRDNTLLSYVLVNIKLIVRILHSIDFDMRSQHWNHMNASGLQRITDLCRELGIPEITLQLKELHDTLKQEKQHPHAQQGHPSFASPNDVWNVLCGRADGNRRKDFNRRLSTRSQRLQAAVEEAAEAHAQALRARLELEAMEMKTQVMHELNTRLQELF